MKYKILTAALAAFLMLPFMTATAYAGGGEDAEEPAEAVTESAVDEGNAFTPDGTGTVVDNATDEDGKEFFTITTANDNVFYLIIDRQRSTENVYFLNAVTETDLLALAVPSDNVSAIPDTAVDTEPEPAADADPDPAAEAEPEPAATGGNNTGTILLLVLVLLGGGGAGYYFKILRPKQQAAAPEDDYPESEYEDGLDDYDSDPYGEDDYGADDYDAEAGEDAPPWDDDDDESEDGDA